MDGMNNNTNTVNNDPTGDNKTFTQDDVNRIVQERLAKEKQKGQEELIAKESELAAKAFRLDATAILREKGLPDELVDIVKADNVEEFSKNIETIMKLTGNQNRTEESQVVATGSIIGTIGGIGKTSDPIRDAFGLKK